MRLGVKPHVFLGRLLLFFALTYLAWIPAAPAYTRALTVLARGFIHLTEGTADPRAGATVMEVRQTTEDRPAIYFRHGRFTALESGIPAEWVQANLVLLLPLMLASPAATYSQRFKRLAVAVGLALAVQVLDITLTVKSLYASALPSYGEVARRFYQFADVFSQSFDTQLFPVVIWAGIHFRQLLGLPQETSEKAAGASLQTPKQRRARRKAK